MYVVNGWWATNGGGFFYYLLDIVAVGLYQKDKFYTHKPTLNEGLQRKCLFEKNILIQL